MSTSEYQNAKYESNFAHANCSHIGKGIACSQHRGYAVPRLELAEILACAQIGKRN